MKKLIAAVALFTLFIVGAIVAKLTGNLFVAALVLAIIAGIISMAVDIEGEVEFK